MENSRNPSSDGSSSSANPDAPSSPLWPEPEEGRRLMRAFFGIRQPALRQAILTLANELHRRGDDAHGRMADDAQFLA